MNRLTSGEATGAGTGALGLRAGRLDIHASAIADYAVFGRSWWIRERQLVPGEVRGLLEAGTQRRLAAGAIIAQGVPVERLVTVGLAGAVLLATIPGLLWFQG